MSLLTPRMHVIAKAGGLLLLVGACHPPSAPVAPVVIAPDAGDAKPWFRLEPAPVTACMHDAVCEAHVVLVALQGYKVNPEYPTKFVSEPSNKLPIESAEFAADAKDRGTMTIKFRPAKAGSFSLAGQFKFSVCTEDTCQIESPVVSFDVTAS